MAHNAAFDMSVWRATLDQYGLLYPSFDYLCTLKMVQKVWAHLSSHRLPVVADFLELTFEHHNAAEDARMCGLVTLAVANYLCLNEILDVPDHIEMYPGRMNVGRSEEHTSDLQSLMRTSYAVFC